MHGLHVFYYTSGKDGGVIGMNSSSDFLHMRQGRGLVFDNHMTHKLHSILEDMHIPERLHEPFDEFIPTGGAFAAFFV